MIKAANVMDGARLTRRAARVSLAPVCGRWLRAWPVVARPCRYLAGGVGAGIPEAGWRASIDGNLLAAFLTLKSFLPGMKARRRGAIITMASSAGRQPDGRAPIPYGAAKAAIALLTQDVAAQAGPYGIRVNCIAPETILTERNQERIPPAQQAAMAEYHPLKRLGTTQDVATAAEFLASDDAAWITGTILDDTGGAVMT